MNILSLFDGISCGRLALDRAGIPVENYFASEIDKFAMQVSKANWPDIQHIGDVRNVVAVSLPPLDLLSRLTPLEVERLFALPDGYTSVVSDSQRYRCMGNGWVVDVITHILSHIEK